MPRPKIDELADRAIDGSLTAEQRAEYEALIATASVIALLQAKARNVRAEKPAA
jgi:hypothetical protein